MEKFNNIVFLLDKHTNESSPSLQGAISLAKTNQANLTLLKVLPDIPPAVALKLDHDNKQSLIQKTLRQEKEKIKQLLASINSDIDPQIEVRIGKTYIETIRTIKANHFDLLIKEVDGVDWLDRLFGSEDMHLLRKCPCPIWLMKKNQSIAYKNIMLAIDFDDDLDEEECAQNEALNRRLLDISVYLSLSDFTTLHIVNAYEVPQSGYISLWADQSEKIEKELLNDEYIKRENKLNTLLNDLKARIGDKAYNFLSPKTHIIQGPPSRELPKLANEINADLVVMGTVARTGISGVLIGNTAENTLSQLQCSVLTIKPNNFISPVS